MNSLPVALAYALENQSQDKQWLIEQLWSRQAVGVIGGEPKCCKSFLALTLAVAVASGRSCLGQFSVTTPGRVLLYPAEDALHIVRKRLDGICNAQNLSLQQLPIFVITKHALKLDIENDRKLLQETIKKYNPSLLIIDPFVRIHSIDENASGEVSKLLAHLRYLQRSFSLAVIIVHHAKKSASSMRPGQALRGSGDFHAWGDSNLYLRRDSCHQLSLTIEHRAEPEIPPLALNLVQVDQNTHLAISQTQPLTDRQHNFLSLKQHVIDTLKQASSPLSLADIRLRLKIRNATASSLLTELLNSKAIQKSPLGFSLPTSS